MLKRAMWRSPLMECENLTRLTASKGKVINPAMGETMRLPIHKATARIYPIMRRDIRTARFLSNDRFTWFSRSDLIQTKAFQKTSQDRKCTRLNSSHQIISYAVFC